MREVAENVRKLGGMHHTHVAQIVDCFDDWIQQSLVKIVHVDCLLLLFHCFGK